MSRNSPVCSVPVESLGGVLLGAVHDAVTLGQGERTVEKKKIKFVQQLDLVIIPYSYMTHTHTRTHIHTYTHLPMSAQQ